MTIIIHNNEPDRRVVIDEQLIVEFGQSFTYQPEIGVLHEFKIRIEEIPQRVMTEGKNDDIDFEDGDYPEDDFED